MRIKPYEPKSEALKAIRRRLSEQSWLQRVEDARRRMKIVAKINKRVTRGETQNASIEATVPHSKRSATLRDLQKYRQEGFEGLNNRRTPRDPEIPTWVREAIEVARVANPSLSLEEVEAILEQKVHQTPSRSTIKRIWKSVGLQRRAGRPAQRAGLKTEVKVEELEAAGFQLVRAAEAETGAVDPLVETVVALAEELPEPGPVPLAEQPLRNEQGQRTARYNQARRKAAGELIAPPHRTAEEKAEQRDLGRLQFRNQRRETIARKVWALVSLPAVTPVNGRIEDLRGPQGRPLVEMCGYAYQAETLRKVVSEFSVAGLGPLLQQTQAETWHSVSRARWENDYRAHGVYVDNNVKPLWTGFFTKSTKVSSTGRVQPALTSTFVNTGVEIPIHFETTRGAAPLAPRVLTLLEQIEEQHDQPVGRLTVIDGECCSVPLLAGFKDRGRDLIVPLAAKMIRPKRCRFGRGSSFRPYRNGDQVREGANTLASKDLTVDARAIIIERRIKDSWTVLVTLADAEEWSARGLADATFGRWPNQEGFFRRANQALGLKRVHGYGKRVVANTAVLTELETLQARIERARPKLDQEIQQLSAGEEQLDELHKQLRRVERYRAKREQRVDEGLEHERTHMKSFATASAELREASEEERRLRNQAGEAQVKDRTTPSAHREMAARVQQAQGAHRDRRSRRCAGDPLQCHETHARHARPLHCNRVLPSPPDRMGDVSLAHCNTAWSTRDDRRHRDRSDRRRGSARR